MLHTTLHNLAILSAEQDDIDNDEDLDSSFEDCSGDLSLARLSTSICRSSTDDEVSSIFSEIMPSFTSIMVQKMSWMRSKSVWSGLALSAIMFWQSWSPVSGFSSRNRFRMSCTTTSRESTAFVAAGGDGSSTHDCNIGRTPTISEDMRSILE